MHTKGGLYLLRKLQEKRLKEGKELRCQSIRRREQLERDSALNSEFLQALDEKYIVFEAQAAILGKLAAQENYSKGLSEVCGVGLSLEPFPERVREVEEAIAMLKY